MIYKHKQLSTKLAGADFSAPRASFPACTEPLPELVEGRSKLACAEPVEASKHPSVEASNPVEVSLYHHIKFSNHLKPSQTTSLCRSVIVSSCQIFKSSNHQNVKMSNRQIFKSSNN